MLRPILPALLSLCLLGACQLALPGRGDAPVDVAAVDAAAAAIEVTALDAAPAPPDENAPAPPPDAEAMMPEAAPEVPEVLKSASQIACEKRDGRFVRAGNSTTFVCVTQTRDGGKRCSREQDCEGLCLARSRSCSPITPVLGCQDILQQDGLRVTQCVQ